MCARGVRLETGQFCSGEAVRRSLATLKAALQDDADAAAHAFVEEPSDERVPWGRGRGGVNVWQWVLGRAPVAACFADVLRAGAQRDEGWPVELVRVSISSRRGTRE